MKSRPKNLRFTLRTLFLLLTISAVWLAFQTNDARRQAIAVAAIEATGGRVRYDFQRKFVDARMGQASMPGPFWLRKVLGDDFFRRVVEVDWNGKTNVTADELAYLMTLRNLDTLNLNSSDVDDSGLKEVAKLQQLKKLHLEKCSGVTDIGLSHISRLTNLEYLSLLATKCTDSGIRKHIPLLRRLRYLDLTGLPVTNNTVDVLPRLEDLDFVHLGRVGRPAKFDLSDAVASMKTDLPQCTVNYWGPVQPQP